MKQNNNILLENWDTPYGIPPFDMIKAEHFVPAIESAIELARKEIESLVSSQNSPTFDNTIVRLEEAGKKLNVIAATLFNLNSAETNPGIQEAVQQASKKLVEFSNDITLNADLFLKIKEIYHSGNRSELNTEQLTLLEDKYRDFRKGGAELKGEHRERFRRISEELAVLSVNFEENLLSETNAYELHIKDESDLEGLPDSLKEAAAEEATSRKKEGWVFTLQFPSYIPFMQYSRNRRLRKQMFEAYSSRCFKKNESSNIEIVRKIVNLRFELAALLGFDTYADYVLENRMAGNKETVSSFLSKLFDASRPYAERDYKRIKEYAISQGHSDELEKWDWHFYAEGLKKELFSIDDEILRPYFQLENVEKALFNLAETLYGLKISPLENIRGYHPDVKTFEVSNEKGGHISVLMLDYHPRKGKSGGAWMTAYREQYRLENKDYRPIVSLVMNFTKASSGTPALLNHNELTTLMHEFGHALHGMLSRCTYESLSGTSVKRDFVELPSQLMENWAYEKEWLDKWAVHYKTGQKIPEELINKIKSSLVYNEGYACNRQLSFAMLDMAWHSISEQYKGEIDDFEKKAIDQTELFKPVPGTNQSCAFGHLFSGGYAAGYYGYKWAEVLDADSFSVFKQNGIFDRDTADLFRENILEKGGSDNPMILYKQFRGKEPDIDAFLKRSGFLEEAECG